MTRPSSREMIIDAAEQVVIEVGPNCLTLDAVAQKAGLSKGGLLYHFPTKEALLDAMIARLIEKYEERRDRCRKELQGEPACLIRAHFAAKFVRHDERAAKVSASLLAALVNNREMLSPARVCFQKVFEELTHTDGKLNPDAAILLLAVDGLMMLEMMGLSAISPADREAIVRRIDERARELE